MQWFFIDMRWQSCGLVGTIGYCFGGTCYTLLCRQHALGKRRQMGDKMEAGLCYF
jgi:hypothetical protein